MKTFGIYLALHRMYVLITNKTVTVLECLKK